MTLSDIIQTYRREHNVTMGALAKRSGVSTPYISMLESNKNSTTGKPIVPSVRTLQGLAAGMDISLNQLFDMMEERPADGHSSVPAENQDVKKRIQVISNDLKAGTIRFVGGYPLSQSEAGYLEEIVDYTLHMVESMEEIAKNRAKHKEAAIQKEQKAKSEVNAAYTECKTKYMRKR